MNNTRRYRYTDSVDRRGVQHQQRLSLVRRSASIAMAMLFATSCSAGGNDGSGAGGALHACEIAPAVEVSRIFGKAVSDASPSMESANGNFAMSQCSYRFDGGGMGLSVQIRRYGHKVGTSRQADADDSRKQKDSLGIGEDVADAIEAGTDVQGLGNLAYDFDDHGNYQQLVVYWDDFYQLAIISFGGDDAGKAFAARKELAQLIVSSL